MKRAVGKTIDLFLIIALVVVAAFIFVNRVFKQVNRIDRVNISISSQCGDLFGVDLVNALIQEFEAQNPDLRIQMTSQENADIVFFNEGEFNSLLEMSALASLAPYIYTETQEGHRIDHWALPLLSFMDIFLYNIDILQAAQCDRPPKTRAEFLAAAKAVAGKKSAAPDEVHLPFALGLSPADPLALRRDFYPWIWMDGGELQLAGTDDNPALPRVVTNTITFFGQLHREGLLAPDTFEKTGQMRLKEFAEGNIAMMTASSQDIPFLRHNARDVNFGITTIPATVQGKNRLGLLSIYAGINSACALPDEAWMFLAFIAGKSPILAQTLGAVPGSSPNAFPGEYIVQDPLYSKAWEIFEAAEIAKGPGQPLNAEIERIIREKLEEVFTP
ncbi:MAG: extracellular solute-binding protein [Treponema sp.]|nr:extracellular solute-binding protein [Treponema sp.]